MSFAVMYPATWSSASAAVTRRARRPMTTASSASRSSACVVAGRITGSPIAHDRVGELREEHGPGGQREALFPDVAGVVLADADDLAGLQRWRRPERRGRDAGHAVRERALEGGAGLRQVVVLGEQPSRVEEGELLAQAGVLGEELQRQHAIADEDPGDGQVQVVEVGDEAHGSPSRQLRRGRGGGGRRRARTRDRILALRLGSAIGALRGEGGDGGDVKGVEEQDPPPDDRGVGRRQVVEAGDRQPTPVAGNAQSGLAGSCGWSAASAAWAVSSQPSGQR